MSQTYPRRSCPICRAHISTNGLAWTSHMRKHVRAGEALERRESVTRYPGPRDYVTEFDLTERGKEARAAATTAHKERTV